MTRKDYNDAIDMYADRLFRFAVHIYNDQERCRDIVQEAFTVLWEKRDNVEPDSCKSFLFTLVQRKAIDAIRREKTTSVAYREITLLHDEATDPATTGELREALCEAMQLLPAMQKTILQLHDIEGYDYKEIAGITGQKYRTVQVAAFRARVKLKEILIKMNIIT